MADKQSPSGEKVLIVGTGAMASLFAARLTASGQNVCMQGHWQAAIETINSDGLLLIEGDGSEIRLDVQAGYAGNECPEARLAIVLVKAWQTEQAAAMLAEVLHPEGVALSLQNGLGNFEILSEHLGAERVALGSTSYGAKLAGAGIVEAGGDGEILLGEREGIAHFFDMLSTAGFHTKVVEDLQSVLWGKLAINAAINPMTALLEVPNGQLLEREDWMAWMRRLAEEVGAVAAGLGIRLPFEDASAAAIKVAQNTAANRSSMLQDIERGAPTEIEAICGEVVRAGINSGVETAANQLMLELVRAKVQGEPVDMDKLKG